MSVNVLLILGHKTSACHSYCWGPGLCLGFPAGGVVEFTFQQLVLWAGAPVGNCYGHLFRESASASLGPSVSLLCSVLLVSRHVWGLRAVCWIRKRVTPDSRNLCSPGGLLPFVDSPELPAALEDCFCLLCLHGAFEAFMPSAGPVSVQSRTPEFSAVQGDCFWFEDSLFDPTKCRTWLPSFLQSSRGDASVFLVLSPPSTGNESNLDPLTTVF